MAAWWLSTTIARHCTAGTSADCPVAPNGTDPKKNEAVMMARTFRMAFAESWDGPHLSLRGFKSYIGRLPINPYVSFNKTEKVCQKGSRGLLAQEDPDLVRQRGEEVQTAHAPIRLLVAARLGSCRRLRRIRHRGLLL